MVYSLVMYEDDEDIEHGVAAYKAGRCRCEVCKSEWAALMGVQRRKRGIKPRPEGWGEPEHGQRARYNAGCRCEACRQANREYARERYKAKKQETEYVPFEGD